MLGAEKYGVFVDTQGTGSVYSSLVTRQGENGEERNRWEDL